MPEEVKEVPGRPGTPNGTPPVAKIDAIPTGAYGWDDVVKYKRKDNAGKPIRSLLLANTFLMMQIPGHTYLIAGLLVVR